MIYNRREAVRRCAEVVGLQDQVDGMEYALGESRGEVFLKAYRSKTVKVSVHERYRLPNANNQASDWNKFWLLKEPSLRGIRLKVAWKDVMSNERRHRFKITDLLNQ